MLKFYLCALALLALIAACGDSTSDMPNDIGHPEADTVAEVHEEPDAQLGDTLPGDGGDEQHGLTPREADTYYLVGAAQADLNPEDSVPLGGFGMGGGGRENLRYNEGIHDDVVAGAFAVMEAATGEFVIFVGVDSLGLMREDVLEIQARFGALAQDATGSSPPTNRIVLSASHAHSTPDTVGLYSNWPDEQRDLDYIEKVYATTAQVAWDAFVALEEAHLEVGRGWLANHLDVEGMEMDAVVTAFKATRPDGSLIGTITNWGAHPTVYGHLNNAVSADFVGTFRHALEQHMDGGVHVFLQGPIGGVYPLVNLDGCDDTNPFEEGYKAPQVHNHHEVACVGFGLAREVTAALEQAEPLAEERLQIRVGHFDLSIENILFVALGRQNVFSREFFQDESNTYQTPSWHTWLRLGGIDFLTAPGEAFPKYAAALRTELVEHGATETVIIGLGNDWVGYLLLEEQYRDDFYGYHRGLSVGRHALGEQLEALRRLLGE